MRIDLIFAVAWVLFWSLIGYGIGVANSAEVDLPIRAGIWNLDSEPIHSLALSECARHGFPCHVQCRDAPVVDIVNACIEHELCCFRAGPYLDDEEFNNDNDDMEPGVYQ